MDIIRKQLVLQKEEYYIKHLSIVNVFLPKKLTPKEIEVIAAFMSLEGDIAEQRFGSTARKIVRNNLNLSPGGLGNYMKKFREEGFIRKVGNDFEILPILYPENHEQGYMFKLKRK